MIEKITDNLASRHRKARLFYWLCTVATFVGVAFLAILIVKVTYSGIGNLSWDFVTNFPSRFPSKAGLYSSLIGTFWMISLTAIISIPVGIGAAVYLEEYASEGVVNNFIEINIANLAGVPSVVYGILGLAIFVRGVGFERSVISGALTMSLLILPMIIITARESMRAVPRSIRMAAYALGATRWQTISAHVIPSAMPSIMTGIILAVSRAMGESAPLIMIGALTYVAFTPSNIFDAFTVLPIQIFNWVSRPQPEFQNLAAAGIIVLLVVLLSLNAIAVAIRFSYERKKRW